MYCSPLSHRSLRLPPRRTVQQLRCVPCRSSLSEVLITQSEIIGKGLTLFVFFAASLNYLYYRGIRIDVENLKKEKEDKGKKNGTKHDGKL